MMTDEMLHRTLYGEMGEAIILARSGQEVGCCTLRKQKLEAVYPDVQAALEVVCKWLVSDEVVVNAIDEAIGSRCPENIQEVTNYCRAALQAAADSLKGGVK